MRTALVVLLALGVAAGGAAYYVKHNNKTPATSFRTSPLKRGDIAPTIPATGTLEPEELVDVGAQITGKILGFGPDPDHPGKTVDFCSKVHKDQLLATIDPTYYQAKVDQCKAALKKAEAELEQLKATCKQKKNEWERAKELKPMKAIAGSDYDAAEADYLVAQANIAVGQAAVRQAEAALSMAEVDLDYTVIRSPVEGVVIDRRVNVGQTVTSGLNTPSIFLIAKDLRRMQIWVSVNEADIGRIFLGMPVGFTVATFPDETFHGEVTQIRYNAQMTQNVVTYFVIVTTENPELKLFPYMTATVSFEEKPRKDVLMVPNAALQWAPEDRWIAAEVSRAGKPATPTEPTATPQRSVEATGAPPATEAAKKGRVWVVEGDKVRPLEVVVGITDDVYTEISGPGVKEGLKVVIGESKGRKASEEEGAEGDSQETTNPFLPKPPKGFRRRPPRH